MSSSPIRIALIVFTCGFTAGVLSAQTAESPAKFEASDVHVSRKSTRTTVYMSGGLRGDQYGLRNATMLDLISTAYGADRETVLGGPSWLEFDRFDVAAKTPKSTTQTTVGPMLQALLEERFLLKVHKDTKPLPTVVLTAGKGKPKLKEADGADAGNCMPGPPQPPQPGVTPVLEMHCRNVSMDLFARMLRGFGGPYFDQPLVNETNLPGNYDIELKFTPRPFLAQAGSDAVSIFAAVEGLGLKLETQNLPRPVIVVDSVQEKPTPNAGDVSRVVPPQALAEFEVAVVKQSLPDAVPQLMVRPGGQVDIKGVPLKMLVAFVWGFDPMTNDMVVNAPKSMETGKYDIMAKVSSTASRSDAPQLDIDDIRSMLRALIEERFQLKWHMEDRPVSAYTLVAVKPKMKKGDPAMRASWKEGPGPDGKDPRIANPILSRLVSFQNISMAQFAEDLQRVANGYVHSAVIDETGLEGGYDFTLSFSAAGLLQSSGPGRGGEQAAPASGAAGASDPNGAVSLPDAINKQLGLKLEMQKRPMPVLVIDHVDEKPTDN